MFIRSVKKRLKDSKYEYIHLRLVESFRTSKGVRQRVILNLGSLELPKENWKDLANAIEGYLINGSNLFDIEDDHINKLALHFSEVIKKNRLLKEKENRKKAEKDDKNEAVPVDVDVKNKELFENVDLNSITPSSAKHIGVEYVINEQMKEYKFSDILKSCGFTSNEIIYAKLLISSKAARPSSELKTVKYLKGKSGILDILNYSGDLKIYDNALHRIANKLYENKNFIEKSLSTVAKKNYPPNNNIILYDLTNTYFEGRLLDVDIAQKGRSKEKQKGPLVTLALMTDSQGFPQSSQLLPGNIGESTTLKSFLEGLNPLKLNELPPYKKNIIIDSGIGTEKNLDLIKEHHFHYITVSRKNYSNDLWKDCIDNEVVLSDGKTKLKIKYYRTENEILLHCYSPLKAGKEKAIIDKRKENFEKELNNLNLGLLKKGTRKKYSHILEKIGRLKEKYKVGYQYDIEVLKNEKEITTKISFTLNNQGKRVDENIGRYILRTNNMSLSDKEISKIYRSLTTIEASFRSMKSDLGLRPVFHKKEKGIKSHIFANVLTYNMIIPILIKLRKKKIRHTWSTIREDLENHLLIITSLNNDKKENILIKTTTQLTPENYEIYKALNLKLNPIKKEIYKENMKK